MSRASENERLWHPIHWPTWAGMGLFWLTTKLPWSFRRFLAACLGTFVYYVVPVRKRVVLINLTLCFPDLPENKIRALARAHYRSLALGLFETCAAWWSPAQRLPRHQIVGFEHLEKAHAEGRGVILLTAHLTTLEMCGRILNEKMRMGCLYRDPNNAVIARLMRRQRERQMSIAVHFDDLKGLIRALRAGHAIWYAPDQGKRTKLSEVLPFFGVPAITNTATGKLAEMTRAPVVPYFGHREPDGTYRLTLYPPLDDFPTKDSAADAVRVNKLIEEQVRQYPEQYLWVHKRFKRRGPGYPEVY